MTRLFLSLYLFIAIMLVVLSGVLNHIFFDSEPIAPERIALTRLLTDLHQSHQLSLEKVQDIGLTANTIAFGDINWSAQESQILADSKAVTLFDSQVGTQLYFKLDESSILEVNLSQPQKQPYVYLLYSGLFFLFLAIGIALWILPLWRDTQKLNHAASNMSPSEPFVDHGLEPHSLLYPIATALEKLNNKVAELLNTQIELTGAVAHEFRTPLSRLKFTLAAHQADLPELYQSMNDDINELEKLMQEMLSYTSLENQQPELSMAEIPLLSLCEQRVECLIPKQNADIHITLGGQNVTVLADEHFVERAVDNLLTNALRYAKSEISVSVMIADDTAEIYVEDDGIGIESQYIDKIFEPFFRPDSGRARHRGGAGLGLAIVKRIMLWHGGNCWADKSRLGGAKFVLSFPSSV